MKRKRIGLLFLLVPVILFGSLGWLTYRQVRQENLNRALIVAIMHNDTSAALALLDQGADPNTRDEPPQQVSVWQLFSNMFRPKHSNPSKAPTALLIALKWFSLREGWPSFPPDNPVLIHALLVKGANANVQDETGFTPLLWATFAGSCAHVRNQTVRLLLEYGANVNPLLNNVWGCDRSPLMRTIESPSAGEDILEDILKRGANVNARDNGGRTPLMDAVMVTSAMRTRLADVQLLLRYHADPNLRDESGYTVLSSVEKGASSERTQLIQALKQAGAKE